MQHITTVKILASILFGSPLPRSDPILNEYNGHEIVEALVLPASGQAQKTIFMTSHNHFNMKNNGKKSERI